MSTHENGLLTDRFNGHFRLTDGLDLSKIDFIDGANKGIFIAEPVPSPIIHRGSVIEDYPFPDPFASLSMENALHQPVLSRLNTLIDELRVLGSSHGISTERLFWALSETIQNATQYGGTEANPKICRLLNLNWELHPGPDDSSLTLAITNPCRALFDPSKYPMMTIEEICDLISEGENNGHLGTTTLLGYSGKIEYAWQLPDGDRILFSMRKMSDEEIEQDPESALLSTPLKRHVERINRAGESKPYALDDFLRDARQPIAAESVVIVFQISADLKSAKESASEGQ